MSQKCEQFSYGTFGAILLEFLVPLLSTLLRAPRQNGTPCVPSRRRAIYNMFICLLSFTYIENHKIPKLQNLQNFPKLQNMNYTNYTYYKTINCFFDFGTFPKVRKYFGFCWCFCKINCNF